MQRSLSLSLSLAGAAALAMGPSVMAEKVNIESLVLQGSLEEYRKNGYSVSTLVPVYSQSVQFSYPNGFKSAHEVSTATTYIHEWIPKQETLNDWTIMFTLTGNKDLALSPGLTPEVVASRVASGFRKACPSTFAAMGLGTESIDGHDAFKAIVACGNVLVGEPRSETSVLLVIKGSRDYYILQVAERSSPISMPPTLNKLKATQVLNMIRPIKICPNPSTTEERIASCQN